MIRTLNSLRFILILMIVISHSTLPISQGLHDYLGEYPVAIFFVISGFVLSLSKGEKLAKGELSNKQFFLSRIIKLYPLHLLILALLIPMDWRLGHLEPWYQILAHALLIQCWFPTHNFVSALNAATWFLSDILFFYLIFKYLYRWIMKNTWSRILPLITIYMVAYLTLVFITDQDYSAGYIYCFPPFRLIDFLIGILLYKFSISPIGKELSEAIACHMSIFQAYIADLLVILLGIGMFELSLYSNANFRCAALYWLPSTIIVFYMTAADKGKGWLSSILHNKQLLWLGSLSFEIYLSHGICNRLVQSILLKIYGEDIPYLGLQFMVSLILIIFASWLAKKYIVTPIYKKL